MTTRRVTGFRVSSLCRFLFLRRFVLLFTCPPSIPRILNMRSFQLTIRDNVQPQPSFELQLPSLERLHLAGGRIPYPFATLGTLAESCPRLAHLLLTEPFINDETATMLETLLRGNTTSNSSSSSRPRRLTDSLQSLILSSSLPGDSHIGDVFRRILHLSIYYSVFKVIRPHEMRSRAVTTREIRYPLDEALRDWTGRVKKRAHAQW